MRPELEPLPDRMKHLLVDERGYPVPWFVPWFGGKPEFRGMDGAKRLRAIRDGRCWVCGSSLYREPLAFVVGPMCGINRTTAEPPCHVECATWSARNCPFLTQRELKRREDERTQSGTFPGVAIKRNPGVALVWVCTGYSTFNDGRGDFLIKLGEPTSLAFWSHGRMATRAEILESIESGFPLLAGMVTGDAEATAELLRMKADFEQLLPAA